MQLATCYLQTCHSKDMDWLKHLTFAKLEFVIETTQPMRLPPYKGSSFRGAFGNVFKDVVCLRDDRDCGACILTQNCSYYYVFETPNPGTFPDFSSPKLPHPYILEPPLDNQEAYEAGETLLFNLILFGKAIDYLPYFIFVFDEMGKKGGLGKYRRSGFGDFCLRSVHDVLDGNKQIYDGAIGTLSAAPTVINADMWARGTDAADNGELVLHFLTPTRIKHKGQFVWFKGRHDFPVKVLLENLYRRAFLLTFGHCIDGGRDLKMPAFSEARKRDVRLRWQDWERYSNRQRRRHPLGGFIGKVVLTGKIEPYLPLLKAGEIVHAGSATSFGLGKLEVK